VTFSACFVALLAGTVACSEEVVRGQLMIVIDSDFPVATGTTNPSRQNPHIDRFSLAVFVDDGTGGDLIAERQTFRPDRDISLPEVIAVGNQDTENPTPVRLDIVALAGNQPLGIQTVRTQIPADRLARLDVQMQWLCRAFVKEGLSGFESTCATGQTCLGGACVDARVAEADLLTFSEPVFGSCFSASNCFAQAERVEPDENCSLPVPRDTNRFDVDRLNVAFELPSGQLANGCENADNPGDDNARCLVVLPQSAAYGWFVQGNRLMLPQGLCADTAEPFEAIWLSEGACPTRRPGTPLCGDSARSE